MKLVTYEIPGVWGYHIGALLGPGVADLTGAYALYLKETEGEGRAYEVASARITTDMVEFLRGGPGTMNAARQALEHLQQRHQHHPAGVRGEHLVYPLSQVRLRAPVPRPLSMRDTLNFELHMRNSLKALNMEIPRLWYEMPTYYRTTHTCVAGPEDPILWPSFTEKLDYELEFGIFIGKEGKNIPKDRAREHIAGYTIFNDVSARDILGREIQLWVGPAKGKNFDNANIMGPCLVTPDEIPDPYNLRMVARVNGEVWSEGNSKDMYFKFEDLIEYISKDEPLYPGEFIGSGTVGFGCCLELGKWIKPGDVIELEVEGIGVLRNRVVRR